MRETFQAAFQITQSDPSAGTFKGFAAVFNTLVNAWCPTYIRPGAFTKTLREDGGRVRILWQHDRYSPIGKPIRLEETAIGLEIEARISQTVLGNDCLTLMRDEVVTDLSIGFDPVNSEMEERPGQEPVRYLNEVRLWEVSPVTWGANEPAKITDVHQLFGDPRVLREYLEKLGSVDVPEEIIRLCCEPAALLEGHAGKVLSTKNLTLVEAALKALQALRDAAAKAKEEDEDDEEMAAQAAAEAAAGAAAIESGAAADEAATVAPVVSAEALTRMATLREAELSWLESNQRFSAGGAVR